ncbi:MAG: RNA polymerase sigma factor [Clostridia bacterium]|jgi:RNA polymerase sigma-70 factor (ECF subfamily)|nr:RNA polymerase sigma factor [Clostridia bacterium]
MISDNAFAQEVREVTDTAFAVSYLILGNSTDCEDAVGQAVLQAYESRGKLRKRESFRAWFIKILRNEAYGILRRQRRVQPVDELPEQSAPQEDTDERLDLQSAMMELDADQRTALLLQQEGYSMEEIAQTLDAPVGTVKSRIYRAKSTLRTILQEN